MNRNPTALRVVAVCAMTLACAGPGGRTSGQSESRSRELRRALKIYTPEELDALAFRRLAAVSATSCSKQLHSAASEDEAVDQLLAQASRAGGTGIADLSCESAGANLATGCLTSVTCRADVVEVSYEPKGWSLPPPAGK